MSCNQPRTIVYTACQSLNIVYDCLKLLTTTYLIKQPTVPIQVVHLDHLNPTRQARDLHLALFPSYLPRLTSPHFPHSSKWRPSSYMCGTKYLQSVPSLCSASSAITMPPNPKLFSCLTSHSRHLSLDDFNTRIKTNLHTLCNFARAVIVSSLPFLHPICPELFLVEVRVSGDALLLTQFAPSPHFGICKGTMITTCSAVSIAPHRKCCTSSGTLHSAEYTVLGLRLHVFPRPSRLVNTASLHD